MFYLLQQFMLNYLFAPHICNAVSTVVDNKCLYVADMVSALLIVRMKYIWIVC